MRSFVVPLFFVAPLALLGCPGPSTSDDGGAGDDDAAVDAAVGPAPPTVPMAPAAPELPSRACPEGWVETEPGCAPFATELTCSGAEAVLPGEAECVAVGLPCPAGLFAAPPASGEVIYVSASAAGPGDGSASSPYDQLFRALARATSGTTILLSKGEHVGSVDFPSGVHLRGACAAETTLRPETADAVYPTLLVQVGGVEISDLTLTGDRPGVFSVGATANATLRGVVVDGALGLGLLAQGGTLDASEVLVRGTRTASGAGGRGIDAVQGGTLTLSRSSIERAARGGTLISSGATATLTDVSYVDPGDRAVFVQDGATARLERLAILRVNEVALAANDAGTSVTARDLYVAGDGDAGREDAAVGAGVGALVDADGVWIERVGDRAIFATDADTTITIDDAVLSHVGARGLNAQRGASIEAARIIANDVRDVVLLASSEGSLSVSDLSTTGGGRILRAQTGGTLTATRARLVDVVEDAVQSSNEGTMVVVEDLEVHVGTPGMAPARGAAAFSGSSLTLRRASISDAVWAGASVFGPTTTLRVEDVDFVGVEAYHDGTAGYGMAALEGTLVVDRARIAGAHTMGIGLGFGARATLRDVSVSATQPEPATGLWGRAISSQGPMDELTVERGVFEESIAAGVFAGGESTFDLRDIVVRTTRRRDCPTRPCVEGGVGVVSFYGASIRLESFLLTENDLAGAQLGENGELDFVNGVVSDQPVGVSIQTTGYDVRRLTEGVRYDNNGSNLDTAELPVPSEVSSIVPTDEPPED